MCPGRARSSGARRGIEEREHGGRTVGGGDAGAGAVTGVDRHGERGALRLGVVGDHQREPQLVEPVAFDRHADHAAGVADHERHRLGRHLLRRHDEVALVLAIGVVDDDHDLAARDSGDGVLDRRERHGQFSLVASSRSTYFASTSTSRLTGWPTSRNPRLVTPRVCGMTATVNESGPSAATVRLTPSTVIEPLSHDVAQDLGGRGDLDRDRAVGLRRAGADGADRVDVALHEVAAEPVGEPHRAFEVHAVADRQRADRGAGERLGDGIRGEAPLAQRHHGEAAAVHRDRRAELGVVEHRGGRELQARAVLDRLDRAHRAQLLDDPREHQARCSPFRHGRRGT